MYSLILMTAMSGAPEAPQFNGFFRNMFNGCQGESCYGCYGSGVSRSAGCYGSCHGFGSRLRAFFNGGSCYGSGTSRSAGCYGSGYSCHGAGYACFGSSYSCGGGYVLPAAPDGFGAPPPAADGLAPYAPPAAAVPGSAYLPGGSGPGCCGDGYTLGTPARVADPYISPIAPDTYSTTPPAPMPAAPPASVPEDRNARRVALASPASDDKSRGTVVVKLPTDAKLYAEGRPLTQSSGERTFVTPPLPGGRDYTYSFRAEYVRDGETISQTKRVAVRPGQSATVEFADLTLAKTAKPNPLPLTRPTSVKAEPVSKPHNPFVGGPAPAPATPSPTERARITVKLPPGATLYVDGKKNDRTEAVREFSTPVLKPGQEYAYLMKAEVTRDGRPESQLTKVTFRAGEIVTVDFTAAPGR
ncbi:MAG TPA: TIGR03000 domain-containing protein [Fimbriiglobus sp.]|nr:TIGR03000 domain-containing protein [Fimbriiglobus sp.]